MSAAARVLAVALPAAAFAVLAGAIVAVHGAPFRFDEALHRWSVEHRGPAIVTIARVISASSAGLLPFALTGLCGWLGSRAAEPRRRRFLTAVAAAVSFVVALLLVRNPLAAVIARPRPIPAEAVTVASGGGFPSGHSTASGVAVGFVIWAARRSRSSAAARACIVLALSWGAAVGLTRVYLGAHWPSDVLGAWLLSAAWLALTLPAIARRN